MEYSTNFIEDKDKLKEIKKLKKIKTYWAIKDNKNDNIEFCIKMVLAKNKLDYIQYFCFFKEYLKKKNKTKQHSQAYWKMVDFTRRTITNYQHFTLYELSKMIIETMDNNNYSVEWINDLKQYKKTLKANKTNMYNVKGINFKKENKKTETLTD